MTVWFVAIPDEIYQFGKPQSKIPKSEANVWIGLLQKGKKLKGTVSFTELNELKEAYTFEVNFHNQLKAKLLADKVVTQIIRESTVAYGTIWINKDKIEYEHLLIRLKLGIFLRLFTTKWVEYLGSWEI